MLQGDSPQTWLQLPKRTLAVSSSHIELAPQIFHYMACKSGKHLTVGEDFLLKLNLLLPVMV